MLPHQLLLILLISIKSMPILQKGLMGNTTQIPVPRDVHIVDNIHGHINTQKTDILRCGQVDEVRNCMRMGQNIDGRVIWPKRHRSRQ